MPKHVRFFSFCSGLTVGEIFLGQHVNQVDDPADSEESTC